MIIYHSKIIVFFTKNAPPNDNRRWAAKKSRIMYIYSTEDGLGHKNLTRRHEICPSLPSTLSSSYDLPYRANRWNLLLCYFDGLLVAPKKQYVHFQWSAPKERKVAQVLVLLNVNHLRIVRPPSTTKTTTTGGDSRVQFKGNSGC